MARALGNLGWIRRTMDSVTLLAEINPRSADRVVWPGGDFEVLVRTPVASPGIEIICRLGSDRLDLHVSVGAREFITADRRRIACHDLVVRSKDSNCVVVLTNFNTFDRVLELVVTESNDVDFSSSLGKIGAGIERGEKLLIHVELLGKLLSG